MNFFKIFLLAVFSFGTSFAYSQSQCEVDARRNYERELRDCGHTPDVPQSNNYCTCVLVKKAERFYQQCAILHHDGQSDQVSCFGSRTSDATQDATDCANFISSYRACD